MGMLTQSDRYLPVMNAFGRIFPLTIDPHDLVIPFPHFLRYELSVVGSCTATPDEVEQMLQFAAKHGIKPIVEYFPMTKEGIATAAEKLEKGTMRYRGVLIAP
jgi:D-arabinose 1-dehydrogenase-like Zn-dependent alcohol dehydrogenase